MKKVFIDTNVMLDYVLHRDGFDYADIIFKLAACKKISICTSVLSFANFAYVLRKCPNTELCSILKAIRKHLAVLAMDEDQFDKATDTPVTDFEDFLQYQCAIAHGCEAIVTNNTKHFHSFCIIPLFTPEDFLLQL